MNSLEQRVLDLEKRVLELEKLAGVKHEEVTYITVDPAAKYIPASFQSPESREIKKPGIENLRPQKQVANDSVATNKKAAEAVVGKYLIGALASFLIFIAAVSLIALVWERMTPEAKLTLLVVIGGVLTTIGFITIRKHKNAITAIVLGTGAGLLFIDILAANMAFSLISKEVSIFLALIWAAAFIFSYPYTKMFFMTVIAYIGTWIVLILGLSLIANTADYVLIIGFTVLSCGAILLTGHQWFARGKQLACTLFTMNSFVFLMIWGIMYEGEKFDDWGVIFALLLMILFALSNRFYVLVALMRLDGIQVFVGIIMAILTFCGLFTLFESPAGINILAILFMSIFFVQLLINEGVKRIYFPPLSILCSFAMTIGMMTLMTNAFDIVIGASVVSIILLLINKIKKTKEYRLFICFLVFVDCFHLIDTPTGNVMVPYILFTVLQLGLMGYLLYDQYVRKDVTNIIIFKVTGFFVGVISLYFLVQNVINAFTQVNGFPFGYLVITLFVGLLAQGGYFLDWNHKEHHDASYYAFYGTTTLIYFLGMIGLSGVDVWYEQMVMVLSILAVALIQSANILKYQRDMKYIGIWLGFKYFMLSWSVLGFTYDVAFESVIYSLVGLILALLSITIGFIIKIKSLRLYGLILTILMVMKFILVDLNQENSIVRVVALLIGGIICFGISVLYTKLNNRLEEKKED